MKALRRFTVRAHLPDRLSALGRLSINLRWSWDKPTQDLFASIDPQLWQQSGQDPVALLVEIIRIVRDRYDGRAGVRSPPELLGKGRTQALVDPSGWLVEEQDVGIRDQGPSQDGPLLLAPGELEQTLSRQVP